MLAALEHGVKGGKWFSLMDKVYAPRVLEAAFRRVNANRGKPGVDRQTVEMFAFRQEENLTRLHESLRNGSYQPQSILRVYIPKPGRQHEQRPLGIPTVCDRVAQTALRYALEPIFEQTFAEHSYGFRPGRGCKDALRRVDHLLKEGYTHVVDADLKSFFDTLSHARLMTLVKEKIADSRVLLLIEAYLSQQIMDDCRQWTPEDGVPQGAIISPLLSNIYLNPLDHSMAGEGYEMVRYADDFVVLCKSAAQAQNALKRIRQWVCENELTLHPEKTRLVDASQEGGFDFLGYHFERGMKWPSRKSAKKLKDSLRPRTKRKNGNCLKSIIHQINPKIRGWFEYFKHGKANTFNTLDGWIRMRLRSILRKRMKKKGRGRGSDHQRWPNAFFADQGLFSMTTARQFACQSAQR
jgi:RNA-directed DNA polymerase